ncbi:MAG TPA: molybdenum cofactor biosynthesis protein MoaE [Acidobacteriota bacterium]|jgi:molybdopterin synthase catalytic subunit
MIAIVDDAIQPSEWVKKMARPEAGALVSFEGVVRNHAHGKTVTSLEYHAYRPMALREMERIEKEARSRFRILDLALVHRLGPMSIGETSVLVLVISEHRDAAFQACRFCIDALKTTVPIWKKEYGEGGEYWIEGDVPAI